MAKCPYCKASISEEVSRFGGNCASCLIEIPGEEAATDPGEDQGVAKVESASRGPIISSFVAAVVVLIAVGAWYSQHSASDAPEGEALSGYRAPSLSTHKDQAAPVEAEAQATQTSSERRRAERREKRNRTGGRAPTADARVAEGRVVAKANPDPVNPLDPFALTGGPLATRQKGTVLTGSGEIRSMVSRVLARGQRRLQPCYEQTKQSNPAYKGEWSITVQINTNGSVESVRASASSGANSRMERCIRSKVKGWKFQRVASPVSGSASYYFGG